jgi:glycosyltransferase involved in cell wall biosynthesis/O-antigen/teichoic acid export membrane protein
MSHSLNEFLKNNKILLMNSWSLLGTYSIVSITGFIYWWLATQRFTPEVIGISSASISAMILLGLLSTFGLETLLLGELRRHPTQKSALICAALTVVGVISGLVGIIFAIIAPYFAVQLQLLHANVENVILFAIGVSLTAISLVLDQALIGLLRGELQFWRNTIFSIAKLLMLFIIALYHPPIIGLMIYAAWVAGSACSLLILAMTTQIKDHWINSLCKPHWSLLRTLRSTALLHHILNLLLQTPPTALPLLVTIIISSRINALFYISSMIAYAICLPTYAVTTVLYPLTSSSSNELASKFRCTLSLSGIISIIAIFILQIAAQPILNLFGHIYAEQAEWCLRILGFAALPIIIKTHYVVIYRIRKQLKVILLYILYGTCFELFSAILGAYVGGLIGLSLGWLMAMVIESLCMLRLIWNVVWPSPLSITSDAAPDARGEESHIQIKTGQYTKEVCKPKKGRRDSMPTMILPVSTRETNVLGFKPVRIMEVELGQPLPMLSSLDKATGRTCQLVRCLIRLHTQPLGEVELVLNGNQSHAYVRQIWQELGDKINEHLQQDGLSTVARLDEAGISAFNTPHCIKERDYVLAYAPFVSVIVATRDRPEQLQQCLRSLVALHYPRYEIIVVDNAPKTSTTFNLIQQEYRDVHCLRYIREEIPGHPRAQNKGIDCAKGEILAFTDDDTICDPFWLVDLVKAFSLADNVVCVTGNILPAELETPAQTWFERYYGFSKGFTRRILDRAKCRPDNPLYPYFPGYFGAGANMAFQATYLRSVGGFDTTLSNGPDIDAFIHVITYGYRLVYEPAALVRHVHRRDYEGLLKQAHSYGIALATLFTKIALSSPQSFFDIIARVPCGIMFFWKKRSDQKRKKRASYPKELTSSELKGMLKGPIIYAYRQWREHMLLRANSQ